MTPSESPPPYSPNDPYAPPSPERRTSPQPGEEEAAPPPMLSLRGGYLRRAPAASDPLLSPAAYFDERNFESEMVPSLMVLDCDIHPATKRDELPFPLNQQDRELRDVTDQDWATFVNFLLTELGSEEISGETEKGRRWGSMTPEEFFRAKARMENIANEWNEAFFMPRGIHFNGKFSFNPPTTPTSSQAASEVAAEPSSRSVPNHPEPSSGWATGLPHPPPHPMMNWGFGGRGRMHGFGGFGGRGFGAGFGVGPMHGPSFGPWQHHGHRNWPHHGHKPWEHTSGPSRRQRRSSSVSSASSSSSEESSAGSIAASDISGVDVDQVRQAIAKFRLDPTRKRHLKMAVHSLHQCLREEQKNARNDPNQDPKAAKAARRENRKAIRTELRGLKEEVRNMKRQRRQERQIEKRARKAEQREAKRNHNGSRTSTSISGRQSTPSTSSRGQNRYADQERGVTGIEEPLTPPPEAPVRQDSDGQAYRLVDLSKSDRKLENDARQLEMQADSMDHYVSHWDRQIEHYEHVYAQHDISAAYADERREAYLATYMEGNPRRAARLADCEAKAREKAKRDREKRSAKAEDVKQKLLMQREKAAEMATELRRQAAETRSKMENAPAAATRDSASMSSRDNASESGTAVGSNYFERKGKEIENWGERFGRDMEAWGERFGRDVEAWGKRMETWGSR